MAKRIGIAVVEHAGRYLVGVRPEGVVLAGFAEFPGGKCEPGELPERCAERECREETGLVVSAVEVLQTVVHTYDHGTVELHFWRCAVNDPEVVADNHLGFRWRSTIELTTLNFPDANRSVIAELCRKGR